MAKQQQLRITLMHSPTDQSEPLEPQRVLCVLDFDSSNPGPIIEVIESFLSTIHINTNEAQQDFGKQELIKLILSSTCIAVQLDKPSNTVIVVLKPAEQI